MHDARSAVYGQTLGGEGNRDPQLCKLLEFDAAYGADPGASGCQAIITRDRQLFFHRFMKTKQPREIRDWLFDFTLRYRISGAREYVHAIRGKDKDIKRIFTFGENNGKVEMAVDSCYVPCVEVDPGTWQRFNKVAGRHAPLGSTDGAETSAKMRAYQAKAIELFPNVDGITQDVGAAVLICNWQWYQIFGGNRG